MSVRTVEEALEPLIQSGTPAVCGITMLEILFSARGYRDFREMRSDVQLRFETAATMQSDFERAIDVMDTLCRVGKHRSVPLPDLIIGAVAERTHLTVIHYDQDFDHIGAITGQPMQWVVPRGSI